LLLLLLLQQLFLKLQLLLLLLLQLQEEHMLLLVLLLRALLLQGSCACAKGARGATSRPRLTAPRRQFTALKAGPAAPVTCKGTLCSNSSTA
jgi:hypothetical protein